MHKINFSLFYQSTAPTLRAILIILLLKLCVSTSFFPTKEGLVKHEYFGDMFSFRVKNDGAV
jgi:hypothetical protein